MDPKLKNAIVDAVNGKDVEKGKECLEYIVEHLNRDDSNNHECIKDFQKTICKLLEQSYKQSSGKEKTWTCEKAVSTEYKDSIDIYGNLRPYPCVIEIDTVRHDQIAAKFVSRVALCGLDEPIDYVAILYDSTQESGRQSAEKYVRYMDAILKTINSKSSVLAIYIHVEKERGKKVAAGVKPKVEVWNCERQGYTVNRQNNPKDNKPYMSMPACAEGAVSAYIKKNPSISYADLEKAFSKERGSSYVYETKEAGKGHKAKAVGQKLRNGEKVYVDTQFRKKGYQTNWFKFIEICKENGISIGQVFLNDNAPISSN